jgi:hypothetical protein
MLCLIFKRLDLFNVAIVSFQQLQVFLFLLLLSFSHIIATVSRCFCLDLLLSQFDFHIFDLVLQLIIVMLKLAKFLACFVVLLLLS